MRLLAIFPLALAASILAPASVRADGEAEAISAAIRKAARRVLPAVVTVRGIGGVPPLTPVPGFRRPGAFPGRDGPPEWGGSGVVVDAAKGYVLTNDHVIPDVPRIVVTLPDGRERTAREVRRDPRSDLALVVIDPKGLASAEWGDSDALDLGDWVLAIGQPFGLAGTVSAGIVSTNRREFPAAGYDDLIQTGAAINPGSSGGPLIDLKGRIVGINVAIKTLGGGYEGVGFAVPSSRAKRVAADLAEFGRVRRSFLGVGCEPIDPDLAAEKNLLGGARITSVSPGSPAEAAGLRPGDVILKIDDRDVTGPASVRSAVELLEAGREVRVKLLRDGQAEERSAKLAPLSEP